MILRVVRACAATQVLIVVTSEIDAPFRLRVPIANTPAFGIKIRSKSVLYFKLITDIVYNLQSSFNIRTPTTSKVLNLSVIWQGLRRTPDEIASEICLAYGCPTKI